MPTISRFENLEAWQEARILVRQIYALTDVDPFSRDFPLRDQIRRSAISVMGNIAEGFGREGNREFLQFLSIARGSCDEVRSHLYIALDQRYITNEALTDTKNQVERVAKLIGGLSRYLRNTNRKGRKFE